MNNQEKYTDELLLQSLKKLKIMIKDKDVFTEDQKQEMYETLQSYINQDWSVSTDLLKYLFTGWALHSTGKLSGTKLSEFNGGKSAPK